MDQLFAPWRIEWVRRDDRTMDGECVFCSLPRQDSDRENLVVARSDSAYVLLNNYPYNPGHLLVIPYVHEADYPSLSDDVLLDHSKLTQRALQALETALNPDGFNTGMNLGTAAGGSIGDHLHTHVVPRWSGDTNFMPIVDDTKVIVEALDATYDSIHEAFAEQQGTTGESEETAVRIE
ncbi:MAG: HIT domain-containing protein [Natrialbaceae archaeon]|nr:HIT domain-containing protein [Natrialbaceae archaeon]